MTIRDELDSRSHTKCELCASEASLNVYDVLPNQGPSGDTSVLVCAECRSLMDHPSSNANHWFCLKESIWSEFIPVQVLTYRILKALKGQTWAQDLIDQLYLDDDTKAWADAGLPKDAESQIATVDSNGTVLNAGDTVTLIKDLVVKGANFTAKRGTTVKNIALTDDPLLIEGRVNGTRIVLVAAYLKKA